MSLRPGERVYRAGEPADTFFVVEDGSVAVSATPRGEESPRVIREARRGEVFGEEATVRVGGARQMDAACVEATRLARIPVAIYLRAVERSGGAAIVDARARALRRQTMRDLLRATSFARSKTRISTSSSTPATGSWRAAIYRRGDPAKHVFFVADGW